MDAATFGADVVEAVRSFLEQEVDPLLAKITALQAEVDRLKALPAPKDGDPGKSVTVDDVAPLIETAVAKHAQSIKDAMEESARSMIAAIEIPKAPELPDISAMVADAVAALPPAEKGKDADPVEVAAQIAAEVERAVAALPAPQDGKSVTIEELRPMVEEIAAKAVAAIPVPKDGTDGKDGRDGLDIVRFIRDDKGHLNGILRDGTTVDLGEYVGKDGAPGRDGADGVGFEDMEERVEDEGRTIVRTYKKGDQVKEFRHKTSIIIYRDVFKEGQVYQRGDVATFGGSSWHCNLEDTTAKPGTVGSEKAWTLMTKRGRDGKDGQMKPAPKSGPVKVG